MVLVKAAIAFSILEGGAPHQHWKEVNRQNVEIERRFCGASSAAAVTPPQMSRIEGRIQILCEPLRK